MNGHVHFLGIGGKGLAPAAGLALQQGMTVTGTDLAANHRVHQLAAAGARITTGTNDLPALSPGAVLVSTPAAAPLDVPAWVRQRSRLEFVQDLLDHRLIESIAVAGSLGKSTAATLGLAILGATDLTAYIGADVPGLLCGSRWGTGRWAIVEACEYRDAYLALRPTAVIALNATENHQDHFGDGTAGMERSLVRFVTGSATGYRPDLLIAPGDLAHQLTQLATHTPMPAIRTVGFAQESWRIDIRSQDPNGTTFRLHARNTRAGDYRIPIPGRHLVFAAACWIVLAREFGLPHSDIHAGLAACRLPDRRMSVVHQGEDLVVVDDNARQPAQVERLLQALRQAHPGKRLHVLISPWGTRTKRDLMAWLAALTSADHVWVLPVGRNAADQDGIEDPNADRLLVGLLADLDVPGEVIDTPEPLLAALPSVGPVVVATAGYDASLPEFTAFHQALATAFPATPRPAR